MSDSYAYILAELLKRNTQLHGNALNKRGKKVDWPLKAVKVIITEIRKSSLKNNTKVKAQSGQIWGWLRSQNLTTRQIYQLLLQWALYLTTENFLYTHTGEYADLLEELRSSIEAGAEGEVEDIDANEIINEWHFLQENYYSYLHNLCIKFIEPVCP